MYILGINAYHGDASACLLHEGQVVAAVEEERLRRIKHWAGFPELAIRACLDKAGIRAEHLAQVAINRDPKAGLLAKLSYTLRHPPHPRLVLERLRNARKWQRTESQFRRLFPGAQAGFQHVEHHHAHLACAHYTSPMSEAVLVSVDGFGDFASAAWGLGQGKQLRLDGRIAFPHSLGVFYQALTQYLGFTRYGDENKLMGLAAYGQPRYVEQMAHILILEEDGRYRLNLDYFRHHRESIAYEWQGGEPSVGALYGAALAELLGPARQPREAITAHHADLAASVQAMYEAALFHLLRARHAEYGVDRLALAGGCALNSVANGKITLHTPFREVFVPPAAGDAGGAMGAALAVWHTLPHLPQLTQDDKGAPLPHAYLGPEADAAHISKALEDRYLQLEAAACVVTALDEDALLHRTASALAAGKVVAWFQGAMEWGPRALGNRSILADPRNPAMREILNERIKHRETFRPFAPSVLAEKATDWFDLPGAEPFMCQVHGVRPTRRPLIPAITHVDGSARVHTVDPKANPRFHALLVRFEALSGVPMLLNTSFNEREPIVATPGEALDCFLRTRMDALALGGFWIERRS